MDTIGLTQIDTSQSAAPRPSLSSSRRWDELADAAEGLVHALRNPLFALRLDLHSLRTLLKRAASGNDPQAASEVGSIVKACEDRLDLAEQLLAGLAEYGCPPPDEPAPLRLVDELLAAIDHTSGLSRGQTFISHGDGALGSIWVSMDEDRLQAVLTAMLQISVAVGGAAGIAIECQARDENAILSIANSQWRSSPEERRGLLKPFAAIENWPHSARLATARRFAVEAGGRLSCLPRKEQGTILRLRLPLSNESLSRHVSSK
jgi:signal transduction histidine kinase